jgi:hypothetical protein
MSAQADSDNISDWWAARRRHYNVGLVVAGLAAFALYVLVVIVRVAPVDPEAEVTPFTTALQGMGYLFMMGIANVCYGLGPLLERRLAPAEVQRFRRRAYALGFGFSVALPFCVPLLLCVLPVVPAGSG